MLEKLKGIKERYEQLTALLSDPAVIGDQNRYRELSKEQAGLTDIVNAYDEYMAADAEIESCKAMLEEALGVVKGVCVDAPVKIGDVVVKNIAGTGVDLVATANRERR